MNELYEKWRNALETDYAQIEQQLVRELQKYAQAVVWDMLGETNPDLVQEIVSGVFRTLPGFKGQCQFTTWVGAIARNKVKHELRTRIRRRRVFDDRVEVTEGQDDEARDRGLLAWEPDFNGGILLDQLCVGLPRNSEALLRCKYEGLTNDAIAAKMGLGTDAVESQWARLKPTLQEKMCSQRRENVVSGN